jgi:hypothetical protein
VGDSFWMGDGVKVEWERSSGDCGRIFFEPDKASASNILSRINPQLKDFIFQKAQYQIGETGSQYLDTVWRQNFIRVDSEPKKIQAFISLN